MADTTQSPRNSSSNRTTPQIQHMPNTTRSPGDWSSGNSSSSKTTPLIQVTEIVHQNDLDGDIDDECFRNDRVVVPTIGIDNAAFDANDNDNNFKSDKTQSPHQTSSWELSIGEMNDMHTPLPTPLPINRGNHSGMFVFDPDCASLYSRRGSYSVETMKSAMETRFPRRGSYGDKSSLNVPTMKQIRNGDQVYDGSGQVPPPSPGMLSTNSAWSELLKLGNSRKSSEAGISISRSNSLSVSNVSSSLSEHLRYLVRAFSSRTERVKESLNTYHASPSSDHSEAVSVVSMESQVRHRLDSFFPGQNEDSISEIVRIREEEEYHKTKKFKIPRWIRRLKFPHVIEPQSKLYLIWLFIVTLAFMYNAWAIPLRAVFPYQTASNLKYWLLLDYISDFVYIVDILLFKMRITFLNQGLKETHRKSTRANYMKKRMFKFDCLCLIPLDLLYLINMKVNPWFRLPRVLKIQTFWEFYSRCDHLLRSAHAVRIIKTMTYMLFLIHVETCGYYAMSVYEGIGSNIWVYSGNGTAYIRCFYLATKTATSIGNNPKPTNIMEYMFMTVYWLSGVFVFALLIGQIRDIVDAASLVKTVYTQRMDSTLNYLKNMRISKDTQDRVKTWFIYNWEQQKMIDERQLMETLPMKLRKDLAINVHFNTLSKVKLFQDCDKTLLYDLVLKLHPILYLPGDYVCKKGEIGKEMYIVSQGIVEVVGGPNNTLVLATLKEGSVFGEISLLAMAADGNRRTADVRCKGFTNLFILSKAEFESAMKDYPDAHSLLKKRATRLLRLNARIERKSQSSLDHMKINAESIINSRPETPRMVRTVIQVMNPESSIKKHLSHSDSINDTHKENNPTIVFNGNVNVAYEPGSEYNLLSKAAPTQQEVEAMFDDILTVRDWSDITEDIQKEMGEAIKVMEEAGEHDQGTNSQRKTTSDSSTTGIDLGEQDTKNVSPTPGKTRSNKYSKESFVSNELGDILEYSDCSDDQPTFDGFNYSVEPTPDSINYTAEMFGDIESKANAPDDQENDAFDITAKNLSKSEVRGKESSNLYTDEYAQSFANGFKITIESVDDYRSSSKNAFSQESGSELKNTLTNDHNIKYSIAEIRGNYEELISPDNTTRESPTRPKEFRFEQSTVSGQNTVSDAAKSERSSAKLKDRADSSKLTSERKPKLLQKNRFDQKVSLQKQNTSNVSPYVPSVKQHTDRAKATNKMSGSRKHSIKRNSLKGSSKKEQAKLNAIPDSTKSEKTETNAIPSSQRHKTITSIFTVENETDMNESSIQMEHLNARSISVAEARDTDSVDNVRISTPTIPVENKVTCFAEVHREKTMSPKAMGDEAPAMNLGFPETPSSRQRKISVISIGSVLKEGKETLV